MSRVADGRGRGRKRAKQKGEEPEAGELKLKTARSSDRGKWQ